MLKIKNGQNCETFALNFGNRFYPVGSQALKASESSSLTSHEGNHVWYDPITSSSEGIFLNLARANTKCSSSHNKKSDPYDS